MFLHELKLHFIVLKLKGKQKSLKMQDYIFSDNLSLYEQQAQFKVHEAKVLKIFHTFIVFLFDLKFLWKSLDPM